MASTKLDIIINGIDKASGALGGVAGSLNNMLSVAGGFLAAQVFQRVASGIVDVGKTIFTEAMAAQEVQAQLESVLRSTGGAAGVTADQVNDLATALSQQTRFADDAIIGGENMLLTFTNIGKDAFPLATQTMLDMSQAMGQDLKSSAIQLGKALNDPTAGMSALSRVGVTFTDEQKKQIEALQKSGDLLGAQTIILDELQREFGGAAAAAGGTFAGQLDILKNNLLNVAEGVGLALLPVLSDLLQNVITPIVPLIQAAGEKFGEWIEIFASLAEGTIGLRNAIGLAFGPEGLAIFDQARALLQPLVDAFMGLFAEVQADAPAIQGMLQGMWDFLINTFNTAAPQIVASLTSAVNTITEIWRLHGDTIMAVITVAWQVVITTIGGALVLLAGLIDASLQLILGIFNTFSLLFQGDWAGAWESAKATATAVWDALRGAWETFMNMVLAIVGTNLAAFNQTWKNNFDMLVKIAVTSFNMIRDFLNNKIAEIQQIGTDIINGLKVGIQNEWKKLLEWFDTAIESLPDLVKQILGISSPSKVFSGIGMNIMAGLGEGIQMGTPNAVGAMAGATAGLTMSSQFNIYQQPGQSGGELASTISAELGRMARNGALGGLANIGG